MTYIKEEDGSRWTVPFKSDSVDTLKVLAAA